MVWGDGGTYSTWFSADPEMIQGINTLPITGGHLYLGLRPENVVENYEAMVRVNGGPPSVWQDILWSYLALGDADRALTELDNDREYPVEEGESRAHTYHWIANLADLGTLDATVTADHPNAAVFTDDGARTYVAANTTPAPLTVAFSDGTVLEVAAGQTATSGAHEWSGGGAPSGTEELGEPTEPPAPEATELYLTPDGLATEPGTGTATLGPRQGMDAVGDPSTGLVVQEDGLTGTFGGLRTVFDIGIDAGTSVGNGTRLRVSHDLDGDGTWDRVETYGYFATDPAPGYERYTSANRSPESAEGSLGAMTNGSIKVELWNVLGTGETLVDLATSVVRVPFGGLTTDGAGDPTDPRDPTDPSDPTDPTDPEPEPDQAPGAPREVFVTAASGTELDVAWEAPSDPGTHEVTDYRVQYRTAGSTTWTRFLDPVTATTGARITGLVPGTTYEVRVRAVSDAGPGTFSTRTAGTTWAAPSAPLGLTAKVQGRNVQLTWTTPRDSGHSPVTDYVVEYSSDGSTWHVVDDGVGTATGARITHLDKKTSYLVRVAAVSDVGVGGWLTVSATTR